MRFGRRGDDTMTTPKKTKTINYREIREVVVGCSGNTLMIMDGGGG